MRSGGGKAKGSSFERYVCNGLSLWITYGKQKDIFWRSALSGGRSTVAMKTGNKLAAQAGDISSVHRLGHVFVERFVIECKAYRTLNFEGFIKGKGHLIEFWKIVGREAKTYGKQPMLVGKQNNHPVIVCLSNDGLKTFGLKAKVRVPEYDLNILLWGDFIAKADPKQLKGRVRL